ncbi:MAG: UDP-N-acetylmuramate dehydrogenase [Chlorobi bacterium]|nr:UDP-N-acetylmuramate dehydrogenase [Chlorobiota bacterium]MCE7933938.1 UDP-N-acetylmuramate dehydrogenase [Chlorobi bacterium CHB2]
MIPLDDIRKSFRGRIALNEPMERYTTFRIGGAADIYLEPLDKEDALALITYLRGQSLPYVLMGNGSNILVSDHGVRGAVVNLEVGFSYVRNQDDDGTVVAGAGIKLAKFVDFCISNGYAGTEMLAGIPGTLGGAVIMNAGAYGGEISDHMIAVELIRGSKLMTISKDDAGFAYRTSTLQGDVILEASFQFPSGQKENMKTIRRQTLLKRNSSQPVQWGNAGSIFKNPKGDFAARLIQECGLKGTIIGGAQISDLHANFIINRGQATAADVMALIHVARQAVFEKFAIELELEVKLIGDWEAGIGGRGSGGGDWGTGIGG